jgi:hypothetical protein
VRRGAFGVSFVPFHREIGPARLHRVQGGRVRICQEGSASQNGGHSSANLHIQEDENRLSQDERELRFLVGRYSGSEAMASNWPR